jgi:hypothetical protein
MIPHDVSDMKTPPDKEGAFGRAWRCDLDALHVALKTKPGTTLVSWIVEAPWAHPVWHSYNLYLVHLRPEPGIPDAVCYLPDATHEFMLFALDPTIPREQQLRERRAAWLHPGNFGAQLVKTSDEEALAEIEGAVDMIIAGELNPDTDARYQWRRLFGSAMIRGEGGTA